MAPYGACEVAQSTARSKAQFEAERFRKEIRRKKKHSRRKKKHARAVIPSVSGFKACSSSDFERSVEKAAPVRCFRVLSRQLSRKSCACAVFSSAVEAAQSKKLRLGGVFECGRASLEFSAREWSGEFTI
jgi:hypothetical protein